MGVYHEHNDMKENGRIREEKLLRAIYCHQRNGQE